ncbi:MAG: hypothetical protein ACYTFY_13080 [Planctomycetota bacterium]
MRKAVFYVVFVLASVILQNQALACWAAPPEIFWGKNSSMTFEYKRQNKKGLITVYKAGDRKKHSGR